MGITGIALGALHAAETRFDTSARKLATAFDPSSSGDTVDLSAIAVEMMMARQQFQASANVIRTADEIDGQIINLLA